MSWGEDGVGSAETPTQSTELPTGISTERSPVAEAINLEDEDTSLNLKEIQVEVTDLSGTSEIRVEVIREMESTSTEHSPVTEVSPTSQSVAFSVRISS